MHVRHIRRWEALRPKTPTNVTPGEGGFATLDPPFGLEAHH